MSDTARITVTAGPDKGRVYELAREIVRLGRSPDNEIALTDPQVSELHASIVCREGRFAIHTSIPDGLEVDGTPVPAERWVWLPETATIRMGARTSVEFVAAGTSAAEAPPEKQTAAIATAAVGTMRPAPASASTVIPREKAGGAKARRATESSSTGTAPGSDTQPRSRRSGTERARRSTVAKFITDGPGDPLVKLGEDGHLPELTLNEAKTGERHDAGPKQSNPTLLLAVLGLSMGLTVLMLFMDVGSFGSSAEVKANARKEIMEYYGRENESLKPYQEYLREARRAHSRRDFEGERRAYREVLSQLRSEAKDKVSRYTGITGRIDYQESSDDKKSDKRLEELIGILLSE